jgi:predicted nucleotidyltransferase
MQSIDEEIIQKIKDRIVSETNVEKIIIFGSYAYGKPTEESDIDILVIMETDLPIHRRARKIRGILSDISIPKDIIVRTPSEFEEYKDIIGTIVYPAAQWGKIIYEKSR